MSNKRVGRGLKYLIKLPLYPGLDAWLPSPLTRIELPLSSGRRRITFSLWCRCWSVPLLADSGEQLLNFLTPFGYRLYDERSEAPLSSNPAALERMIGEGASRNVIARVASTELQRRHWQGCWAGRSDWPVDA